MSCTKQFYNTTGLPLKESLSDFGNVGGGTFRAYRSRGVCETWMDVKINGNRNLEICDHSFEIKNIFAHEQAHFDDYNSLGFSEYKRMTNSNLEKYDLEIRAITRQMNDVTFSKMRPSTQEMVIEYGLSNNLFIAVRRKFLKHGLLN